MMIQKLQFTDAINKGEKIAKEYGNSSLPINLDSIAQKHQIHVKPNPDNSSEGVSGMLLRHGNFILHCVFNSY